MLGYRAGKAWPGCTASSTASKATSHAEHGTATHCYSSKQTLRLSFKTCSEFSVLYTGLYSSFSVQLCTRLSFQCFEETTVLSADANSKDSDLFKTAYQMHRSCVPWNVLHSRMERSGQMDIVLQNNECRTNTQACGMCPTVPLI